MCIIKNGFGERPLIFAQELASTNRFCVSMAQNFFQERLAWTNQNKTDGELHMSSSELRYLIAANNLAKELQSVKQTDIANRLHVTKVSAYNAIEKLREKEYIEKNDRKIVLTDRGREVLNEYMTIIRFMSAHLSLHCGTSEKQAYEDALNATCVFSDATRNGIARFIRLKKAGDSRE